MEKLLCAVLFPFLLGLTRFSAMADPCRNRAYERREHGIDLVPYLAYLEMDNKHFTELKPYHASGIIIDDNMILTRAYHCEVSSAATFRVLTGETYIYPAFAWSYVAQYMLHPDRHRRTLDDGNTISGYKMLYDKDFCLLRLKDPIMMSPNRQMAPLPQAGEELPNHSFIMSGWGPHHDSSFTQGRCKTEARGDEFYRSPPFFHQAPPIHGPECQKALQTQGVAMSQSMFCVGYPCKDFHTALGDDGGPVLDPLTQKVVGMVVNVRAFDGERQPQLNLKLSDVVEWINGVRVEWAKESSPNVKFVGTMAGSSTQPTPV